MKRLIALTALLALGAPALAQDAGAIARVVDAGADCHGCDLFQADLSFHTIQGRKLTGSRLRQSDFTAGVFDRSNFTGSNLSLANLSAARFTGANFTSADLAGASMVGAYFGGADFTSADLAGANLSGAEMATAKGLTQRQLDAACGDEKTELPEGLAVPLCG